jgi:hypothetical protein
VLVVPYFLTGITNDLIGEVRRNFRREGERGPPIALAWGTPVRVGDLDLSPAPVVVSRTLLDEVRSLGQQIVDAELPSP